MEIALAWVLPLYLLLIIVFLVVAGINAYHIVRFGTFDRRNRFMVSVYCVVVVAVLIVTAIYCFSVDWSQAITLTAPDFQLRSETLP